MATMEKKGLDTGLKAIHPLTKKLVPIWVTNYVVMDYGSGAVMAVPAHDQRDYEFAQKYGLEIKQVIKPSANEKCNIANKAFVEKGILIHSDQYNDLDFKQAFEAIAKDLKVNNQGGKKVNFRLRDCGISRQRYWGAPIPMIHCETCGDVPVLEKDLPVVLPEEVDFSESISPLHTMKSFYETTCPKCGKKAKRETDTFDTFM